MSCFETPSDGDEGGAAALAAALEFIDDWDELSLASGSPAAVTASEDSASPPASGADECCGMRVNTTATTTRALPIGEKRSPSTRAGKAGARRRPLDELRRLRKEEFELSTRLEALRLDARQRLASTALKLGGGEQAEFWQRAAARQFEFRKHAEGENERLRVLVRAHVRKAKLLRQLLLKRVKFELPSSMASRAAPAAPPADNEAVFAKLLATIDEDYLAAVDALQAKRAQLGPNHRRSTSSISVNEAHRTDADVLLDYFADTVMPFPPRAVEDAIWGVFSRQSHRRNPSFYREFVEISGDEMKSSAHLEVKSVAFHLLVQARIVARKYVERGRTVVVLKSFVEPRWAENHKPLGFECYETNIRVLTPGDPEQVSTRVGTYATLRREALDASVAGIWRHHLNISIAKMVWGKAQLSRNDIVESLLVDGSVRTGSAPSHASSSPASTGSNSR